MSRKLLFLALAVAILAIPFATNSNYLLRLVNVGLIFAILAVSLNIVLGYAGQIALGHAAFFGIGAYAAALISAGGSGLLFWPGFVAAGIVTGISGLLIGIPTLRLKGHYLALATLGFGEIMRHIFFNWREVTHGMDGIGNIPAPSLGVFVIRTDRSFFYLALVILALIMVATLRVERSKYGRRLAAIRDAELAAGTCGVDVSRLKIIAFGFSAAVAGFAGSLYAHLTTYISPDVFVFDVTAQNSQHGTDRRHRHDLGPSARRVPADLPAGNAPRLEGLLPAHLRGRHRLPDRVPADRHSRPDAPLASGRPGADGPRSRTRCRRRAATLSGGPGRADTIASDGTGRNDPRDARTDHRVRRPDRGRCPSHRHHRRPRRRWLARRRAWSATTARRSWPRSRSPPGLLDGRRRRARPGHRSQPGPRRPAGGTGALPALSPVGRRRRVDHVEWQATGVPSGDAARRALSWTPYWERPVGGEPVDLYLYHDGAAPPSLSPLRLGRRGGRRRRRPARGRRRLAGGGRAAGRPSPRHRRGSRRLARGPPRRRDGRRRPRHRPRPTRRRPARPWSGCRAREALAPGRPGALPRVVASLLPTPDAGADAPPPRPRPSATSPSTTSCTGRRRSAAAA